MKKISTILLLVILFGSCCKERIPVENDWQEGVVYFTGEPAVDGCGWLILSEGKSYHPLMIDDEFKQDGLNVFFKSAESEGQFTCGFSGNGYDKIEIREMKLMPREVRFISDYPGRNTSLDMFSMDSVHVDGDSLRIYVGYSGGCAIHQFNLWVLDTSPDDGDPQLMLEHIGNGDPCEAYPHEWLSFSLEPMQSLGDRNVFFWLRGSPQMSSLLGPFEYKF